MALTAKQQRFVAEYLVDLNATQAAVRAGYSAKGAKDQAWQNMQNPEITAAIKAAMEARRGARFRIQLSVKPARAWTGACGPM